MVDATLLNQVRRDLYDREAKFRELEDEYLRHTQVIEGLRLYVEDMERELKQQMEAAPEDFSQMTLGDAMVRVLADGKPLHRKEIRRRVEAMGIHVGGKNPDDSVGARLSTDRQKRFVKGSKKGHWRLRLPVPSTASKQPESSSVIDLSAFQTGLTEG